MSRQPLVKQGTIQHERPSKFLENYRLIIRKVFEESVVPQDRVFLPTEAKSYIAARDGDDTPYCYENKLHYEFWDEKGREIICLVGEPGSGKTTILKYYLKCDCPHGNPTRNPEESERRKGDYRQKLMIHVDLEATTSEELLLDKFFRTCRNTIKDSFDTVGIDLEFVNDCEFWEPIFEWSKRPHNQDLADQAGMPLPLWKKDTVTKALTTTSDEIWVNAAFQFLANYLDRTDADDTCPFKYLVIVFDNLDQSPLEVQKTAIKRVEELLKKYPKPTFWQIYFPFWPESYERLVDEINTRLPMVEIELGAPLPELLFDKLSVGLSEEIKLSVGDKTDFTISYVADAMEHARDEFLALITDLSAYDNRRRMAMWRTTLCSHSLYENYRKTGEQGEPGFDVVSNYALLDGLLTGATGLHNRSESKNPVANLFFPIQPARGPRDILVGLHLLALALKFESRIALSRITGIMNGIGYMEDTIRAGLRFLRRFGIVRFFNEDDHDVVIIQDRVAKGYDRLIQQSAYLDNISMVSPVVSTDGMARTCSTDNTQLKLRIETTWQFISMLRLEERLFCSATQATWIQSESDRERFESNLRRAEIPSYSRKCGLAYHKALKTFRQYRGRALHDKDWEELLSRNEIDELRNLPENLRVGWDEPDLIYTEK